MEPTNPNAHTHSKTNGQIVRQSCETLLWDTLRDFLPKSHVKSANEHAVRDFRQKSASLNQRQHKPEGLSERAIITIEACKACFKRTENGNNMQNKCRNVISCNHMIVWAKCLGKGNGQRTSGKRCTGRTREREIVTQVYHERLRTVAVAKTTSHPPRVYPGLPPEFNENDWIIRSPRSLGPDHGRVDLARSHVPTPSCWTSLGPTGRKERCCGV